MEQQQDSDQQKAGLVAARKRGAAWFTIIGAVSGVNGYMIYHYHKSQFIFSLGITDMVNISSQTGGLGPHGKSLALYFTALAFLVAKFLETMATNGRQWAFFIGMTLFSLDGLIFVYAQDWINLAARAGTLFLVYQGMKANRELHLRFPEDPNGDGAPSKGESVIP